MTAAGKVTHGAATPEGAPSPAQHATVTAVNNTHVNGGGGGGMGARDGGRGWGLLPTTKSSRSGQGYHTQTHTPSRQPVLCARDEKRDIVRRGAHCALDAKFKDFKSVPQDQNQDTYVSVCVGVGEGYTTQGAGT